MVFLTVLQILMTTGNMQVFGSGYDAYTSCYRTSRKYPELPCDFDKQTWCNIPGSGYPWHAVRRFVHENQGLMRRMYGDERHISVLRAELENNDRNHINDMSNGIDQEFQNRYKRPREFTKSVKKKPSKTKKSISPNNYSKTEEKNNIFKTNSLNYNVDKGKEEMSTTYQPLSKTTNDSLTNTRDLNKNETSTLPTTLSDDTTTINTTVQTESQVQSSDPSSTSINSTYDTDLYDYTSESEEITTTTTTDEGLTTTDEFEDEEVMEEGEEEEMEEQEEMYDDTTVADDVEEEPVSQAPPVIRLKGINACPVKEEVVAPFWANNTRGEVLALLNLYPFEQYVHWEKCIYEHKQMFCREGCKCEQQYRLHRLLAYDPNNECRGIFSDWFRFPSCCVCKCYDIPIEFRLTSRSPRKQFIVDKDVYKKSSYNRFNLRN